MAAIIDGRALAAERQQLLAQDTERFGKLHGRAPGLAVILVGADPASEIYVGRKTKASRQIGIESHEFRLPANTSQAELLRLIADLNNDGAIDGILVQLPLPRQIDAETVLDAISPTKDVDGFHPVNVGRLSSKTRGLVPCTPLGCIQLLETVVPDFVGLKAVVIGKSNIVGKPVALLLLERECTVTVTHIHTKGLPDIVRTADIVVVAAGSPGLVRGDWVKPGAVVIDVGINRITDAEGRQRIVGDTCFDELGHAGAITPVPGGVGPMTIASLLENTLKAAWKNGEAKSKAYAAVRPELREVTVQVDRLEIDALIGVNADEYGRRQRLLIDLKALVMPPPGDDIHTTLDYRQVVAFAQSVADDHNCLIETFAARLADMCLAERNVRLVEVSVAKPGALATGIAGASVKVSTPYGLG